MVKGPNRSISFFKLYFNRGHGRMALCPPSWIRLLDNWCRFIFIILCILAINRHDLASGNCYFTTFVSVDDVPNENIYILSYMCVSFPHPPHISGPESSPIPHFSRFHFYCQCPLIINISSRKGRENLFYYAFARFARNRFDKRS